MGYQVLWIDDDREFLSEMENQIHELCDVIGAASLTEGIQLLHRHSADLVLLDLHLGADNGMEGISLLKEAAPSADVVMVSGHKDPKEIVQCIRAGAADYICKPFDPQELVALIEKMQAVKAMRDRHDALIADLNPSPTPSRAFIGMSTSFRNMIAQAERLKGHQANVLIQGESGTGKELLARHIHRAEGEIKRPFIAVNCAAIPEGLIESELFGHEKGSFTGASQRKIGKFELANSGDIFLDEISALRLDLQAKILRVLQEREVTRVGGTHAIQINVRVLSATNEPLEQLVARGQFRTDLYHRLRVIQIEIPALRKRREDIPLLIAHFLDKYSKVTGPKRITSDALRTLQDYDWPGNVRELENVVHSLIILSPDNIIDSSCLPHWALQSVAAPTNAATAQFAQLTANAAPSDTLPPLRDYVREAEKTYIDRVMKMHDGDKSAAAHILKIGRTTLYGKLKELGLMS